MLTPDASKETGAVGSPRSLPYWLRVTLRKLPSLYINVSINVYKGVQGLQKVSFWAQFSSSKSELVETKGKITLKMKEFFTSGTHKIWCVTHYMLYYCEDRKYTSMKAFSKPVSKTLYPKFQDFEYGVLQGSLFLKWIWKSCCI